MAAEVFFVTNREVKEYDQNQQPIDFGTEINNNSKRPLHFGKGRVNDGNELEEIYTSRDTISEELCCNHDIFDEIQDCMFKGIDTIIFFHGFNNTFKDAVIGAAELKRLYEQKGNREYTMIVFSWPSEGKVSFSSYIRDRYDACESGEFFGPGLYKMGRFLTELCQFKDNQKINSDVVKSEDFKKQNNKTNCGRLHIMAHSMGNYALSCTLQKIYAIKGDKVFQLFDETLLIAADEDEDSFEHEYKLKLLPKLTKRVSVYFNQGDDLLRVSDWFMRNVVRGTARLGSRGPHRPHSIPSNVFLINCENVVSNDIRDTEHSYHKTEPEVCHDISYVLIGWKSEDIPGRVYHSETNSYYLEPVSAVPMRGVSFLGAIKTIQGFFSRLRHFRLF